MALNTTPFVVTQGEHTAQQFRMMIKDLAQGNQGITQGGYLKISALSTPGAGVQVGSGSAVIAGVYVANQGFYNVYNIGSDTVDIAATSGTPRSDMIVLRVQDPEYEGNRDPSDAGFFDVIPNVSSSATTVPNGYSAIPLARIDIPASTATITNAYIKDLRQVANPRKVRTVIPYYASDPLVEKSGTSETWATFPNLTMANIAIPSWAANAKIVFTAGGLRLSTGNVFGSFRFMLGTEEAVQAVNIDDNQGTGVRRIGALMMVETIDLTTTSGALLRGTSQAFKCRMQMHPENLGKIGVDKSTSFTIDCEFTEGPL
ncbi:hypothetical protein ACWC4D_33640 [Streptomyces sp. NPDC001288]